jgi:hypothetical protein
LPYFEEYPTVIASSLSATRFARLGEVARRERERERVRGAVALVAQGPIAISRRSFDAIRLKGTPIQYDVHGARLAGHALIEDRRQRAKLLVVTLCIGGGQRAAGLCEAA